jgi:hypothetical protein
VLNTSGLKTRFFVGVAVVFAWLASTQAARADLYGLVIGIDEYTHEASLEGAVNDAEDIAESLDKLSPQQVVVLTNEEATRARITQEWRRLLRLAKRGDTIVLTYAGHGSQEADRPPRDEDDGLDESFLLGTFNRDRESPAHSERLRDDTFYEWFLAAEAEGVRVIFVADACHSGTVMRSMQGPSAPAVRSIPAYGLGEMPDLELPSAEAGGLSNTELPSNLVFFSATQEDQKSPEVTIDGQRRGALSYAFARALEGGADRNGDTALTWLEAKPFITRMVRQLSEAQHYANAVYRGNDATEPLLTGLPGSAPPSEPEAGTIRLRLVNLSASKVAALEEHLDGATVVRSGAAAELTWDAEARTVFNDVGDPVAQDMRISGLQAVIDKWRVLPVIQEMHINAPLDMSLDPSEARHAEGAVISFSSEPLAQPHVTVFNMAPDGKVQFLFPRPELGDASRIATGNRWRLPLKVIGPFGADHLVVVASEAPLSELSQRLRGASAKQLPDLLTTYLQDNAHQIGIQPLYTSRTGD